MLMPLDYNACFKLLFVYQLLSKLETSHFKGRSADLAWAVLLMMGCMDVMLRFFSCPSSWTSRATPLFALLY